MENTVQVRACFTGCNIKSGKTVLFVGRSSREAPAAYEHEDAEHEAA